MRIAFDNTESDTDSDESMYLTIPPSASNHPTIAPLAPLPPVVVLVPSAPVAVAVPTAPVAVAVTSAQAPSIGVPSTPLVVAVAVPTAPLAAAAVSTPLAVAALSTPLLTPSTPSLTNLLAPGKTLSSLDIPKGPLSPLFPTASSAFAGSPRYGSYNHRAPMEFTQSDLENDSSPSPPRGRRGKAKEKAKAKSRNKVKRQMSPSPSASISPPSGHSSGTSFPDGDPYHPQNGSQQDTDAVQIARSHVQAGRSYLHHHAPATYRASQTVYT